MNSKKELVRVPSDLGKAGSSSQESSGLYHILNNLENVENLQQS